MGGRPPEDHSADVARIEAQTAADARAAQAAEEAKKQKMFDQKIQGAFGTGIGDAESYFASQGLDPKQYLSQIRQKANTVRGNVPNLDANPGSYFSDLGQQVYDSEQSAERNRDLRGIDEYAPAGFETSRIGDKSAEDTIAAILGEQENTGGDYITNLLKRGVITTGGADAAHKNLVGQEATARSKLSELAKGIIESGRAGATDIAGKARTRASNEKLGDTFDPNTVGTDLSKYFADFFSGLGTKVRGVAPTNLFDTSGLANVAGASQGAGNNAFNPAAIAGIFNEDDKNKDNNPLGTTSPF